MALHLAFHLNTSFIKQRSSNHAEMLSIDFVAYAMCLRLMQFLLQLKTTLQLWSQGTVYQYYERPPYNFI